MTLQEFKDQLKKDPFSLCDSMPFYDISINTTGVRLQGNFKEHAKLPEEIRACLEYNHNGFYVQGQYKDEEDSFYIVLT